MLELEPLIAPAAGIDPRVAALLQLIPLQELTLVAASASGVADARLIGPIAAGDIVSAHGDARTIGIVRLAGQAEADGRHVAWSAVAKLIDFGISPHQLGAWVDPATELAVYAGRLFAEAGLAFRPARCHLVSHPQPAVAVLWLEDLGNARSTPFSLDELARIVRHLGEWNAVHRQSGPGLGITLQRDRIAGRWHDWNFARMLGELRLMAETEEVRAMYGTRPLAVGDRLLALGLALCRSSHGLPHGLAFGDCNVGNLFHTGTETVAVDWASLTEEPAGVDAGSVIGSASAWGRDFVTVARHERSLFDSYVDGRRAGGCLLSEADIRQGYLLHYLFYIMANLVMPITIRRFDRRQAERRFGMPLEAIPAQAAGIVDLVPGYIEELAAFGS